MSSPRALRRGGGQAALLHACKAHKRKKLRSDQSHPVSAMLVDDSILAYAQGAGDAMFDMAPSFARARTERYLSRHDLIGFFAGVYRISKPFASLPIEQSLESVKVRWTRCKN